MIVDIGGDGVPQQIDGMAGAVTFRDTGPAQFQQPQAAVKQAGDVIFAGRVNTVGTRRRTMA